MSKRPDYQFAKDPAGKLYWRSLAELEGNPEIEASRTAEFPQGYVDPPDGVSRRDFFNLMGAATAMLGLAACRRPAEKIVPFSQAPENTIPGKPVFYATAMAFHGTAVGLLVESNDGRPTKLEGNPQHPESPGGGISSWVQASILEMYDPDRSTAPRENGKESSWAAASEMLKKLGASLRAKQGRGLAVITDGHRSPTLKRSLDALRQAMPGARVVRYEPFSRDFQQMGAKIAFGKPLETVMDVSKAKVIVTLDADILHTEYSVVKNAWGFAQGRTPEKPADMNRLYAIESTFSITGGAADHRLRAMSRDVTNIAYAIADELAGQGVALAEAAQASKLRSAQVKPEHRKFAAAVAKDLLAHKGTGLIVAGAKQPPAVHALCCALNVALGNVGSTVKYVRAFDDMGEGVQGMLDLSNAISGGQIDTVLILGGNPVFNAPADASFAQAIDGKLVIHLASHVNETSAKAVWHLNQCHELENWGDLVSEDGTASIQQPLIAPLFDSRTASEVVWTLLGQPTRAYDLVRQTWQPALGLDFEHTWRRALHDGFIAGTSFPAEQVTVNAATVASSPIPPQLIAGAIELTFQPDNHVWDGRFANNSWLQEWPDPMTKVTWGNQALFSPKTAKEMGVKDGNTVSLQVGDGLSARATVVVQPGQADNSIAVTLGYGRTSVGRVGKDLSYDTFPLRTALAPGYAGDLKVQSLGGDDVARTQEHFYLEGRPHVREAGLAEFMKKPDLAKEPDKEHPPLLNLWGDLPVQHLHRWALAIDLGKCIGCGACQVACQAENNIPVVGRQQVKNSREMNWLRVDRYYEGPADDPRSVAQPLPCQQCEQAPCEQVCPVAATTHSPEGLNDMAYNRCVGTRYCANNCPFKVRKFNFFNYTKDTPTLKQMQYNPDVTVRSRGVMEKCTYCVQRINAAKIDAKRHGSDKVEDGAIQTACQQACPSQALMFGDLDDKESKVSAWRSNPRAYVLLEELNVRPRTTYLAKIRNFNPELERA